MDFLNRLASVRSRDATCAVAVLPSRFSSRYPSIIGPDGPRHRDELAAERELHVEAALPAALASPEPRIPGDRLDGSATGDGGTDDRRLEGTGDTGRRSVDWAERPTALSGRLPSEAPVSLADGAPGPLSQRVLPKRTDSKRQGDTVVHVTIGRIDVVATPAPMASGPRRSTRHATPSLAEYLRGRGGGRR